MLAANDIFVINKCSICVIAESLCNEITTTVYRFETKQRFYILLCAGFSVMMTKICIFKYGNIFINKFQYINLKVSTYCV